MSLLVSPSLEISPIPGLPHRHERVSALFQVVMLVPAIGIVVKPILGQRADGLAVIIYLQAVSKMPMSFRAKRGISIETVQSRCTGLRV